MKKIKEFTVDCDIWLRGSQDSKLKNNKSHMCCLGFLGEACNVINFDHKDFHSYKSCYPKDLEKYEFEKYPKLPPGVTWKSFADINDKAGILTEQRIKLLKERFKKIGIKVKFINVPSAE